MGDDIDSDDSNRRPATLQGGLAREIIEHLFRQYDEGRFPHRLEDFVFLRELSFMDGEGRLLRQPPKYIPIEYVIPREGSEIPRTLRASESARQVAKANIERFRAQLGRNGDQLGAKVVIEGIECEAWPFVPEPGGSIPRKKLAQQAFKPLGFKAGSAQQGMLHLAKEGNDYSLKCSFDFGTWRRTALGTMAVSTSSGRRVTVPAIYWSRRLPTGWPEQLPLLTSEIFLMTMANVAFSMSEIERVFVPRIVAGSAN